MRELSRVPEIYDALKTLHRKGKQAIMATDIDDKVVQFDSARADALSDADAEVKRRQAVLDKKGKQLRFEGFAIEGISTKFKGTVELDVGQLNPYEEVRFEGTGKVIEVRQKDDDGSLVRIQIIKPLTLEIIQD